MTRFRIQPGDGVPWRVVDSESFTEDGQYHSWASDTLPGAEAIRDRLEAENPPQVAPVQTTLFDLTEEAS